MAASTQSMTSIVAQRNLPTTFRVANVIVGELTRGRLGTPRRKEPAGAPLHSFLLGSAGALGSIARLIAKELAVGKIIDIPSAKLRIVPLEYRPEIFGFEVPVNESAIRPAAMGKKGRVFFGRDEDIPPPGRRSDWLDAWHQVNMRIKFGIYRPDKPITHSDHICRAFDRTFGSISKKQLSIGLLHGHASKSKSIP
jgi:hypothetical protein